MSDENELCSPFVLAILTGLAGEILADPKTRLAKRARLEVATDRVLSDLQSKAKISVADGGQLNSIVKGFYDSVIIDAGRIEGRHIE